MDAVILERLLEHQEEIKQEINETVDLLAGAKGSIWRIHLSSVLFIRHNERRRVERMIELINDSIRRIAD